MMCWNISLVSTSLGMLIKYYEFYLFNWWQEAGNAGENLI